VKSLTSSKSVNECVSLISTFIVLLHENSTCAAVEHLVVSVKSCLGRAVICFGR
jgi:hypothetical protein